ncbi:MAG: zinc-ribbon domain-containing protein [Promethearchaeota archaeon]
MPHEVSQIVNSEVVSRSRRSTTFLNTIARVKVPICSKCNLEFKEWEKFASKNRWSKRGAGCYALLMVLLVLLGFITGPDASGVSPLFQVLPIFLIPLGICLAHAILISRKAKKMENNPKHTIKFIAKEVHVKPLNTMDWIPYTEWINNTLRETSVEEIERDFRSLSSSSDVEPRHEYCPQCGTKIDRSYKFCKECGEPITS